MEAIIHTEASNKLVRAMDKVNDDHSLIESAGWLTGWKAEH